MSIQLLGLFKLLNIDVVLRATARCFCCYKVSSRNEGYIKTIQFNDDTVLPGAFKSTPGMDIHNIHPQGRFSHLIEVIFLGEVIRS